MKGKQTQPRKSRQQKASSASMRVGKQIRALRKAKHYTIRALAERSGLSINTLSLLENGKTSPSVHTLDLIAQSLEVPLTTFFERKSAKNKVLFQKAEDRPRLVFSQGKMEKLSTGLPNIGYEPLLARLGPGANSGKTLTTMPGRALIYCLEGQITYIIEQDEYLLSPGDSLIFDARTPHFWRNSSTKETVALIVVCPEDFSDDFSEWFSKSKTQI